LALDTLFWRVSGTIVGTVPYATTVAADAPDRLSQATGHLTPSDRIVETRRKNGCVKKFEDVREAGASVSLMAADQGKRRSIAEAIKKSLRIDPLYEQQSSMRATAGAANSR